VIGPFRLPTWEDEESLPYVRAVIKEIHRWAPVGGLGVPHATIKDDIYDGHIIPAGTVVFPNLPALSRCSERYHKPDHFLPERFIESGEDKSGNERSNGRDHFHYGFGRRFCQGVHVAEASLFIVVSRALWGFEIKPDPDSAPLDMNAKISKFPHEGI
jgi:cytochrome P450